MLIPPRIEVGTTVLTAIQPEAGHSLGSGPARRFWVWREISDNIRLNRLVEGEGILCCDDSCRSYHCDINAIMMCGVLPGDPSPSFKVVSKDSRAICAMSCSLKPGLPK